MTRDVDVFHIHYGSRLSVAPKISIGHCKFVQIRTHVFPVLRNSGFIVVKIYMCPCSLFIRVFHVDPQWYSVVPPFECVTNLKERNEGVWTFKCNDSVHARTRMLMYVPPPPPPLCGCGSISVCSCLIIIHFSQMYSIFLFHSHKCRTFSPNIPVSFCRNTEGRWKSLAGTLGRTV